MKMAEINASLITRLRGLACIQQVFCLLQLLGRESARPATPLHRWKLMGISSAVCHQGAVEFGGIEIEFEFLQHTATALIDVPKRNGSSSQSLKLFNPMAHLWIQAIEGTDGVLLQPTLQLFTSFGFQSLTPLVLTEAFEILLAARLHCSLAKAVHPLGLMQGQPTGSALLGSGSPAHQFNKSR